MDPILIQLRENKDGSFTESINKCKFTESLISTETPTETPTAIRTYNNFVFCILDNYDLILSNTPYSEKKHVFNQRIIEILSDLDDNEDLCYDKFGFNKKVMKINLIQLSIQSSSKKEKLISSIYYLNELYSTHFVIVDNAKQSYYETSIRKYPIKYLIMNRNKFSLSDKLNTSFIGGDICESIFNIDIKKNNIYKKYLEPIGKYKVDELKIIATKLGLSITNNETKQTTKTKQIKQTTKTKQMIYDEINLYKLNLI